MADELKPCPFCGGEATLVETDTGVSPCYIVVCTVCDAGGPDGNPDDAVDRWNHRAVVPIVKEPDNANE